MVVANVCTEDKGITVKLLNNGHPFCRGLVAVVDECPLIRGCGKMTTNPRVWSLERSRSFNLYKVGPSIFYTNKKVN